MMRVASNTKITTFTEFEEDILFDDDDPDFEHQIYDQNDYVSNGMSLAGVHPAGIHSSRSSLTTLTHSLEDIAGWNPHQQSDHVLTIEELRLQMTSCFTCGVSWLDHHVSLDCTECGGYALERPCPECDGVCGAIWKRDLSMSHASSKARWQGECARHPPPPPDDAVKQEIDRKTEKCRTDS